MEKQELHPDTWVDRYADYLYRYALTRVNDEELARDLVQETFIAGLQSMGNFQGRASERTWLVAILKRKVIDHYRRANTHKGRAEVRMDFGTGEEEQESWLEGQVADPESLRENDAIENAELGLAIERCLSTLPERHARVFTLKSIQGWDTEDICKEMGVNPSNVWVIIHRARTALMDCLGTHWLT